MLCASEINCRNVHCQVERWSEKQDPEGEKEKEKKKKVLTEVVARIRVLRAVKAKIPKVAHHLLRETKVNCLTLRKEEHLVKEIIDGGSGRVNCGDDSATAASKADEGLHNVFGGKGIQSTGRLVQEEQACPNRMIRKGKRKRRKEEKKIVLGSRSSWHPMETRRRSPPEMPLTASPPMTSSAMCLSPSSEMTVITRASFLVALMLEGNFMLATNKSVSFTVRFGKNLSS